MEVLSSRILLRPRRLDRSRVFYEETLGLRIYREYGVGGRVTGVVYFLGGGFLELTAGGRTVPHGGSPLRLWLQVPDVADAHRSLQGAGVDIEEPPRTMPWGLREMTIRDPDEVEIVLVEVPREHPLRRRVD